MMTATNPVSVQNYLKGMDYPANKEDLIDYVQEQGVEDDVLEILEQLPDDEEYNSATEVNQAIGEIY
jgi:Protein of unknown function (DUF2795)